MRREAPAVCAWKVAPDCVGVIREGDDRLPVTHGLCEPCRALVNLRENAGQDASDSFHGSTVHRPVA